MQNRKAPRIYPKDFIDYSIIFDEEGNSSKGFLGNISEGGLCAVMPLEFQASVDTKKKGSILHEPSKEKLPFEGRVAWKLEYEINKQQKLMVGLEFSSPLELPEQLMVISLSVES